MRSGANGKAPGEYRSKKLITLASLLELDKDAVVCDLAETYGIYDMGSLPLNTVATLVVGLRDDSRIKMKLRGEQLTVKEQMLAGVVDRLSVVCWWLAGGNKADKPKLITDSFIKREDKSRNDKFASGEEFMKAWQGK